jgi:hypothetical protein
VCGDFCQYIDHSRLRVTPEVRIGGSKGVLWGWVRVAGGMVVQHHQAARDGNPPMIVAPQGWNPGGIIGIGPGVAIAVTGHLFLLIDGMVSYARVPAVDRGGAGIDASVGLGWVF